LAAGLDMPAFRVIIRDLKRYGGRLGMVNIPVLEYLQMAGRAGRPGKEKDGEAICVALTDSDKTNILENYVRGKPEAIYSKLAVEPVLRTYVLSLVSSGILRTESELVDFFSKTFWAYQYKDMNKLKSIISKVIDLLKSYDFIQLKEVNNLENKNNPTKQEIEEIEFDDLVDNKLGTDDFDSMFDDDFVSASDLIKNDEDNNIKIDRKLKPTNLGKRVAELYLDPLTANDLINGLKTAYKKYRTSNENVINEFSILQLVSNTLEMRPLLRVKTKDFDEINDKLFDYEDYLLIKQPSLYDLDYDDFLDSIKTALFFEEWINEKDEEYLFEKYNITPGEIHYKLENAKWLFYACLEFSKILELKEIISLVRKTDIRVKYGVKEELLHLLKLSQIGRLRARKMFNNGIKTLKDVKKIDLTSLSSLIGTKIAQSIKEQVNQEVEEVPKGKRVGQLSIEKFNK
jgi:helicase